MSTDKTNPVLGLFAVVGNWPNWEQYFDLSRGGLRTSFFVLLGCLPGIYLIADALSRAREVAVEQPVAAIPLLPFLVLSLVYLFSFAMSAYLIAMLFDRQDRFRAWVVTRHWAVFILIWVCAFFFAAANYLGFSSAAALGVAAAAYLGLLVIDIRLLMRVVGFGWHSAILLGCCLIAVGLIMLSLGLPS